MKQPRFGAPALDEWQGDGMSSATRAGSAPPANAYSLQLRGGAFTLLVLRMVDPKDQAFYSWLADKVMQAPNFFRHGPVVIDLQDLANAPPFNIAELSRRLRQHWLVPIGVQNGTEEQNKAAVNAGLSVFPKGHEAPLKTDPWPAAANEAPDDAQGPNAASGMHSRLITQTVRSGQQIYAHQGDLVVLASISSGAELLADGHIHVYGTLRGRAVAGVSGDTDARIFCHSLEAELISVAGFWRVRDDIPEQLIGRPVQVFLDRERVEIEPLS
jgi:septum site-determining protein MinC